MTVRTRSVRNRVVGDARKELKAAAGADGKLSKTEAKKLKPDVARAAEAVRAAGGSVTVSKAVNEYAGRVTRALASVDKSDVGNLSATEVGRIRDASLRTRIKNARAALAGDVVPPGPPDTSTGAAAAVVAAVNDTLPGLDPFHESGDHGVNVSIRKVPGLSLTAVLNKVTLDPAAPWTQGEKHLELLPGTGVANIDAFNSLAREAHEAERDDMPDAITAFTDAVTAQFKGLSELRLARGNDLGGVYLIGKAADGYVCVVSQAWHD
ncbi:MAG: hypothetical protein U0228_24300 [Myxococcaceae bacterium]